MLAVSGLYCCSQSRGLPALRPADTVKRGSPGIGPQALPSISINQRDVFARSDVAFQMRTFASGNRCDITDSPRLPGRSDTRGHAAKARPLPVRRPVGWRSATHQYSGRTDIKAQRLPDFILQAYSTLEKVEHRVLLFVTELGIIVKRGENSTFVYATHLKTNMPVRGTKIKIQPRAFDVNLTPGWSQVLQNTDETKIEWSGETDEQGILLLT